MNSAIIFIKNDEEVKLARTPYLGGNLLIHTIRELKKVDEIEDIYVVGAKQNYPGTLKRNNVKDVLNEIGKDGKTIMCSPLYPELSAEDYQRLLKRENGCLATCDGELCEAFMIPNNQIENFNNIKFEEVEIKNKKVKKFTKEDAANAK